MMEEIRFFSKLFYLARQISVLASLVSLRVKYYNPYYNMDKR